MPFLDVTISRSPDRELTQAIAGALLDHSSRILHKKRDLTSIAIAHVPPAQWFIAGKPLDESGQNSFFLDIRIVDGTNTREEKAAFIEACFGTMQKLLGNLHPESYVHVHDVDGEAYGYGGLTQAHRYHAGRNEGPR